MSDDAEACVHHGSCHCGAIGIEFRTSLPIDALPLGRCDCEFCRRHGARTMADPEGHLRITETEAGALRRYQFGLGTADFLLCVTCGVYVAAVLEHDGRWVATLNVNQLDRRQEFDPVPPLASYQGESLEARLKRRLARWTPAEIVRL